MRLTFSTLFLLLLVGCQSTTKTEESIPSVFESLGKDLSAAEARTATHSPWLSGEGVPLTIIGPIYDSSKREKSSQNRMLASLINTIAAEPASVSSLSAINYQSHFGAISYRKYELDDDTFTYIPALINSAFSDESALNAVIESSPITLSQRGSSAEVGLYIDEKAWNNKIIQLSGYKSIKVSGFERNTSWFRYQKSMPKGASAAAVQNQLASMLVYALTSSIREYASVDREQVMQHANNEFVLERSDGDTYAYLYRDRNKMLEEQKRQKLESLDKENVLLHSTNTVRLSIDESSGQTLLVRRENFLSSVELVSIQNSNQRKLIWQSQDWDEVATTAHYFLDQGRVVMLTDKALYFIDAKTTQTIKRIAIGGDAHIAIDTENAVTWLTHEGAITALSSEGSKKRGYRISEPLLSTAYQEAEQNLYFLTQSGSVDKFNLKVQSRDRLMTQSGLKKLVLCDGGGRLSVYGDKALYVINTKNQNNLELTTKERIKAIDCNSEYGKLLVMTESGTIKQYDLESLELQTTLNTQYSTFDKQNSFYVVKYLSGEKYLYGGRDNLRLRSSVSESEVDQQFLTLTNKVAKSSSWLDQSVIDQAIYAEPINESDRAIYHHLFMEDPLDTPSIDELLAFHLEEKIDPILLSNQSKGFQQLGVSIETQQQGSISIVKELNNDSNQTLSASIPDLELLGYNVDKLRLGQHGFDARIYSTLGSASLMSNVTNLSLSEDSNTLVIPRDDGSILIRNIASSDSYSIELSEDVLLVASLNKSNNKLATVSEKGILQVYHIRLDFEDSEKRQLELIKEMDSYAGKVNTLSFIDDDTIMSGGKDQTVKLWSIESGKIKGTELLGHTDEIVLSEFDNSLGLIITSSKDGTIRAWDPINHEQLFSYRNSHDGFIAAFSTVSNRVAMRDGQKIVVKSLITSDTLGTTIIEASRVPKSLALGFDGKVLFIAYDDQLEVRKVSTGELVDTLVFDEPMVISEMKLTPDDNNLAIVEGNEVHLINTGRYFLVNLGAR